MGRGGDRKIKDSKSESPKIKYAKVEYPKIRHPKMRGEWAELKFMVRAAEEGLQVGKPWGESAHYDFSVECGGQFLRVQVKSTMFVDRGGYSCSVRGSAGPYVGDCFDFVAVYLIPEDLWYIIPAEVIRGQGSVAIYPRLRRSKYGEYREAWELLRGVVDIEGCAGDYEVRSTVDEVRSTMEEVRSWTM